MAYPRKLLAADENIVYELRPHWRSLVFPIVGLLLTVGLWSYLFALTNDRLGAGAGKSVLRWSIALVAVFVLITWVIRPVLNWLTTQYVFTNRRIIVRTGLIARRGRDMPLSRVNDVSFSHTVVERFLNCGTIVVESAGTQGQLVIANVPDVETIQREIYRLHDEDDARRRQAAERPDAGPRDDAGAGDD